MVFFLWMLTNNRQFSNSINVYTCFIEEFEETFRQILSDLRNPETRKIVVSDDFKTAIAFANDQSRLSGSNSLKNASTIVDICNQIDTQTKRWCVFSFPFGPLIMKLCHRLNMPDTAMLLITDQVGLSISALAIHGHYKKVWRGKGLFKVT